MTKRQAEALAYIRSYIAENGYSPSFRDIKAGIGTKSTRRVFDLVHALAAHGKITFIPHRARSIELVAKAA